MRKEKQQKKAGLLKIIVGIGDFIVINTCFLAILYLSGELYGTGLHGIKTQLLLINLAYAVSLSIFGIILDKRIVYMEKILNGRMYYIDLEVAEYFMEYLMMKEMDELKDIKWRKSVVRNGKYNDGELIDDMFSISYGFNVDDRLGRGATEIDLDLCIPMIYKNIGDFSEDLYWFLNMEYGLASMIPNMIIHSVKSQKAPVSVWCL